MSPVVALNGPARVAGRCRLGVDRTCRTGLPSLSLTHSGQSQVSAPWLAFSLVILVQTARFDRLGGSMRRRGFLGMMGGTVAWPLVTRAQHTKLSRIGVLVIGNADVPLFGSELREGLRELGRIEGQDYLIEFRSAEGQLGRLPELASELIRLKVDVIIALFTPCAIAAKQATREIPIVIVTGDPLGTGLVESLSRPGGNITGLSQNGCGNAWEMRRVFARHATIGAASSPDCKCCRSRLCEIIPRTRPACQLRLGKRDRSHCNSQCQLGT